MRLLHLFILLIACLLVGCSHATVTEVYLRTPAKSQSIGPGVQKERHMLKEAGAQPFPLPSRQEVDNGL